MENNYTLLILMDGYVLNKILMDITLKMSEDPYVKMCAFFKCCNRKSPLHMCDDIILPVKVRHEFVVNLSI